MRLDAVMALTSHLYDSTAVQALGVIIVGLLSVLAIIWAARNVRLPKRRLDYGIAEVVTLVMPQSSIRHDLEVSHNGTVLTQPRLVTIRLVLRGRQDIASDDYDSDQPLRIGLGTPIVTILEISTRPGTSAIPVVSLDDSTLAIGPSLIHSGQQIKISVLIDGASVSLECTSFLKNVRMHRQRPDDPDIHVLLLGPNNMWIIGTIGGIAALGISQLSRAPLAWIPFIISIPLLLLALIGAAWSFWVLIKGSIDVNRVASTISQMEAKRRPKRNS